jgi:hypothetical protein
MLWRGKNMLLDMPWRCVDVKWVVNVRGVKRGGERLAYLSVFEDLVHVISYRAPKRSHPDGSCSTPSHRIIERHMILNL